MIKPEDFNLKPEEVKDLVTGAQNHLAIPPAEDDDEKYSDVKAFVDAGKKEGKS